MSARQATNWITGKLVLALMALLRLVPARQASAFGGLVARGLGRLLPVSRKVGLANLKAAFPEKSEDELRRILSGVWDNLGRTAAEYPHLDRIIDIDIEDFAKGNIEVVGLEHFEALKADGKPALLFSAHLANWEIPAVVATMGGLDTAVLFRPPNNPIVAEAILATRQALMGRLLPTRKEAVFSYVSELERGAHLAMLVDQHLSRGVPITFFGRPALANPTLARLLKHVDCPVHGVRVIRLPGFRFRIEMTPRLEPARDAEGTIDVAATTAAINRVIEGWVREHPEQWLWLHRRWRA